MVRSAFYTFFVLTLCFVHFASGHDHVYVEDGDVNIGGLFPIRLGCGVPNEHNITNNTFGIQRAEAMLYAIDKINKNDSILR